MLAAARNYAIKEAQKATYRDTNALSQTISDIGRNMKNSKNPVKKPSVLLQRVSFPSARHRPIS